jgi:RNA polymerase sigma factor (TIGR02999 family)
MPATRSEITRILDEWSAGDPDALAKLMPEVVDDLHRMAERYLNREGPGQTLQPTALVNEVYLRLVGRRTVRWQNRAHFFAFTAELMRRILVDVARRKHAEKRGGGAVKVALDAALNLPREDDPDLIAVDDALVALAKVDPRQARIVELRFFAGLELTEIAEVVDVSLATVKRELRTAKLWLVGELTRE